MTELIPGMDGLPSWKVRLLERIQNASADHVELLLRGHPSYEPDYGSGEIPMQTWRNHLQVLRGDRHDIEIRASAVGVPPEAIDQAREMGERGLRWGDSVHSPPTIRDGEDPVRAHIVEGIADDMWQLEHMAAIKVAHRRRGADGRFPPDPQAQEQFDRNMTALWVRAYDTSDDIGVTTDEGTELWCRDQAGWTQLVTATVHRYGDAALHEQWRAYAWRGIEHEAWRSIDSLPGDRGPDPVEPPPAPHELIERATQALTGTSTPNEASTDPSVEQAVETALPSVGVQGWEVEPDYEPDVGPAELGESVGFER
ncbi:hypothetical protein OIE68_45390 [Nocardia vinacea]|uniref:hypothetical protein n=1 Tax=Nocardia vinacea TaxID=96468 RepID=UPI002E0D3EA7|nr:hypothetical protein OIE68_45390 [Nocardia vinacea]